MVWKHFQDEDIDHKLGMNFQMVMYTVSVLIFPGTSLSPCSSVCVCERASVSLCAYVCVLVHVGCVCVCDYLSRPMECVCVCVCFLVHIGCVFASVCQSLWSVCVGVYVCVSE